MGVKMDHLEIKHLFPIYHKPAESNLRKVTRDDMQLVADIITKTFARNPGVNWTLKHTGNPAHHIKRLAEYAFIKSYLRDGVFISSNRKGVALCYQYNRNRFSLLEFWYQIRFAFTSIDFWSITKVIRRESIRKRIRPQSGEYLYFWFLGVLPEGRGAGIELKNRVFQKARKENLPIYLETSLERNQKIYARIGFTTYYYWENKPEKIQFWFMKWEP